MRHHRRNCSPTQCRPVRSWGLMSPSRPLRSEEGPVPPVSFPDRATWPTPRVVKNFRRTLAGTPTRVAPVSGSHPGLRNHRLVGSRTVCGGQEVSDLTMENRMLLTEWSNAWALCLAARFGDQQMTTELLEEFAFKFLFPNCSVHTPGRAAIPPAFSSTVISALSQAWRRC